MDFSVGETLFNTVRITTINMHAPDLHLPHTPQNKHHHMNQAPTKRGPGSMGEGRGTLDHGQRLKLLPFVRSHVLRRAAERKWNESQ